MSLQVFSHAGEFRDTEEMRKWVAEPEVFPSAEGKEGSGANLRWTELSFWDMGAS